MSPETKFKIFLASPGDVQDERNIARAAIEQIRHERAFRDRLNIEVVAWDQPGAAVAMNAGLTPQEAIKQGLSKPSECDLVVVILWSRMGTPLPGEYRKADGSPYLSGTEWEYENAMAAATRSERPAVWVYRRMQSPAPELDDPNYSEIVGQWTKVKLFFEKFTNPDGSPVGGINSYEMPDDFRVALEAHLRDHLTQLIKLPFPEPNAPPTAQRSREEYQAQWEGSPYPGLEAFSPEEAAIFFGRTRETDKLIELLRDPTLRFLAVLGASGSGKSSLIAAGLIPRLRAGALPESDQWTEVTFKPGERADGDGNCPFLSMAHALITVIGSKGYRATDLALDLRADPELIFKLVEKALKDCPPKAELILFIDQFEELLTLVTDKERRESFALLLKAVVEKPNSRVRTIVTMRSDFTESVADNRVLAKVFQTKSLFLLAAPGERALEQMIMRPARVAGVEVGDDLCERLLKDTGTGPGALALMAFTLNELYEHGRTETGDLSLDYYKNELGGVQGAIDKQAEKAIGRIKKGRRFNPGKLQDLFFDLVEVNDQGVATRRRASKAKIERDPAEKKLADTLVEARILVTGHETASTCEVAHEAIFTGWLRLAQWIEANADAMRTCRNLRHAATDWKAKGAPAFKYLPDRATLQQYRRVSNTCRHEQEEDEVTVGEYLAASRRRGQTVNLVLALAVIIGSMIVADNWRAYRKISWNQAFNWGIARIGAYEAPPMARIDGGCFDMGCVDDSKDCYEDEFPSREVCLEAFEIGIYEVTLDQWAEVMGKNPSHYYDKGGSHPVEQVSWDEAKSFIRRLNDLTGQQFRLPTEAEWEYAARSGGNNQTYAGGENLDEMGWYGENSDGRSHPVGQKKPNNLGIYDMSGNVSEWVEDNWHKNYIGAPEDGGPWINETSDHFRVFRGGSWFDYARDCRSATRSYADTHIRFSFLGFRLAKSVTPDH